MANHKVKWTNLATGETGKIRESEAIETLVSYGKRNVKDRLHAGKVIELASTGCGFGVSFSYQLLNPPKTTPKSVTKRVAIQKAAKKSGRVNDVKAFINSAY